jgi:hypothetical protein
MNPVSVYHTNLNLRKAKNVIICYQGWVLEIIWIQIIILIFSNSNFDSNSSARRIRIRIRINRKWHVEYFQLILTSSKIILKQNGIHFIEFLVFTNYAYLLC